MKPEDVRVGTRIVYCGRKLRVTSVRVVPRYIKGKPTDPTKVIRALLADLGFKWTPTMEVGSGTRVHLRADELPAGTLIVRLSGHVTVVSDGTVLDTHDPSRGGTRAVYGYWRQ